MSAEGMDIADVLRAQHINRWTIVNVSRPQSIAEHTFNVIAISTTITRLLPCVHEDAAMVAEVAAAAFSHDLDEIFTGDIPTPAKEKLGMGTDHHGTSVAEIVKAADILEALLYIVDHGIGRHATQVENYLETKLTTFLNECHTPELLEIVGLIRHGIENQEYEL
jgi:5'-deoxynucleotidase